MQSCGKLALSAREPPIAPFRRSLESSREETTGMMTRGQS
jgi:hypothetical protein